jgi:hypothetical protein
MLKDSHSGVMLLAPLPFSLILPPPPKIGVEVPTRVIAWQTDFGQVLDEKYCGVEAENEDDDASYSQTGMNIETPIGDQPTV